MSEVSTYLPSLQPQMCRRERKVLLSLFLASCWKCPLKFRAFTLPDVIDREIVAVPAVKEKIGNLVTRRRDRCICSRMPSSILHAPSTYGTSLKHYLIFFITGNPGLIKYYQTFLKTLDVLLSFQSYDKPHGSRPIFHIFGQSLAGFEDEFSSKDLKNRRSDPFSLQEQIEFSFEALKAQRISTGGQKGDNFDGIILIGHSVGSYILLELLRMIRQDSSAISLNIKAGILLFPTVTHIAQSPSGVKISTLFRIPDFPRLSSILAKSLLWPIPQPALRWIVTTIIDMPNDAADVTVDFLVSERGIWQALHMARDEMRMITEDKWDEDIWGVKSHHRDSKVEVPKLIFYFGQNDHWVAEHTRDALIASRGQDEVGNAGSRPTMFIDKDGIPHGFCIRHSELVAERVKVWIEEIVNTA